MPWLMRDNQSGSARRTARLGVRMVARITARRRLRRIAGEVREDRASGQVRPRIGDGCKTVGSAYVGSNPTPATTQKSQVSPVFRVVLAVRRGSGISSRRLIVCFCYIRWSACREELPGEAGRGRVRRIRGEVPAPGTAVLVSLAFRSSG